MLGWWDLDGRGACGGSWGWWGIGRYRVKTRTGREVVRACLHRLGRWAGGAVVAGGAVLMGIAGLGGSAGCAGTPERIGKIGALPAPSGAISFQDVAWSADGARLGYSEFENPGGPGPLRTRIVIRDADGIGDVVMIGGAMWVTFSPDGKRIAFESEGDGDAEIYTAGSDGSDVRRITASAGTDTHPSWSPRGDRIAFSSRRGGVETGGGSKPRLHLFTMKSDGTDVQQITSGGADDLNPAWSADGSRIVFYREVGDQKDQVYTVRASGGEPECLTGGMNHNTFPSYLPDGRVMYRRTNGTGGALVVLDPRSGLVREITTERAFYARASPDGRRIALVAGGFKSGAVYVCDADGQNVVKVAN